MTKIQINVLNREYTIQCQDGEEQKVQELAEKLNSQMNELQQKIPNVSDINLFVINSLINLNNKKIDVNSQNNLDNKTIEKFENMAIELENLAQKIKNI
ncbi:MAG: cell division protein ZapA [Alphaproteobacteria bacterium]|jgi:cell division protein ZapA (FtsZ GTPase activity inhibitor)|tara:strand:+ start:545 stop:841 length:297 start_codon:yes stop_codon:yes gene_type:complete